MEDLVVRGAPGEYICKVGVLDKLETKLLERKIERVIIVTGTLSWEAAKPFFPNFSNIEQKQVVYQGECTLEEMKRIAGIAQEFRAEAIIGVGGGKVLDTVKGAAHLSGTKRVLIPTLASNCAPWTPLSVIYTAEGVMTHYDVYPNAVDLLLVEPRILVNAPVSLLIAGIGDTLAKWAEADVLIRNLSSIPLPVKVAHDTAKLCETEMLEHGIAAVQAAESKQVTEPFIRVVETIIMLGGMVGGYGDQFGRIAGAHSVHNGLTIVPESHNVLHGDKVAYGILVQFILEGQLDKVKQYEQFYQELGLPKRLSDMRIDLKWVDAIAEQTTRPQESIHWMKAGGVTAQEVANAMRVLESL